MDPGQPNEEPSGSDGHPAERGGDGARSRGHRLRRLAGAAALAALIVVVLVLVSQQGGDEAPPGGAVTAGGPVGIAETRSMFAGIEQNGTTLGDPEAPMVLTEFVDLQCPFCAQAALGVLPGVIDTYVRPGRLRLELRTLRFIGQDSERGAKAAHAAATRDRMWNFTELWFRNQGEEGAGYATDQFIASIARGSGVDPQLVLDGIKSPALEVPVREAERQAKAEGVDSTPTFLIGRQPGRGKRIESTQLTFGSFQQALEPELER